MKILIIGAGRQGQAIGYQLCKKEDVDISFADINSPVLKTNNPCIKLTNALLYCIIVDDDTNWNKFLESYDVVVSAADYALNPMISRAAIKAKTHMCDLGGNNDVVEKQRTMSKEAKAAGITIIPDCGLAPGMSEMLAARAVEELGGEADTVTIRVGGIPVEPKPPLNYALVFNTRGLTNEYIYDCVVLKDNKIKVDTPLTEVEEIVFIVENEPVSFEAFNTSGGLSTLPETYSGKVKNMNYKTIRYPGHCAVFHALLSMGFFSEKPIDSVVPRLFTEKIMESDPNLKPNIQDMVLIRVVAENDKYKIEYEVVDYRSEDTGHTAMMRATGYPTAIIAYMLGSGEISTRGVVPGEQCIPLKEFVQRLHQETDIEIKYTKNDLDDLIPFYNEI